MRVLLLAVTLTACSGGAVEGPAKAAAPREPAARDDPTRRYVVPLARSTEFAHALGVSVTATFEPEPAAVEELEAELPDFLRSSALPAAPRIVRALAKYRRQFVGVEVEGRLLILGNFFRSDDDAQRPVSVDDGGEKYFQIRYEPKTKKFSGLMINGEA